MTTFFAVRDEITEKLKEITAFKQIYTPLNSVLITEISQITPSAHVNFVRINPKDSAGNGKINLIAQQWAVSVACRNAQSQQINGSAVADEAGALLEKVIKLLAGWKPNGAQSELKLVSVNDGYSPGFTYMTAIFESNRVIQHD